MKQKEALKRAYKDVGEELKLFIDGFELKQDNIDQMQDEFQGWKRVVNNMPIMIQ